MPMFIDDMVRQLAARGGPEAMAVHAAECEQHGHRWVELDTNVQPPALGCKHCLKVQLRGDVFWPQNAKDVR
jgi:hypothetical protein